MEIRDPVYNRITVVVLDGTNNHTLRLKIDLVPTYPPLRDSFRSLASVLPFSSVSQLFSACFVQNDDVITRGWNIFSGIMKGLLSVQNSASVVDGESSWNKLMSSRVHNKMQKNSLWNSNPIISTTTTNSGVY